MINLGVGVAGIVGSTGMINAAGILYDPMSHGWGAALPNNTSTSSTGGIQLSAPTPKAKSNTIKAVTTNTKKQSALQKFGQNVGKTLETAVKETAGTIITDTVNKQTKRTQQAVKNSEIGDLLTTLLGGNRKGETLSGLVDMTMKRSVDELLQQQIKKGKLSLKTSQLGKTYATAMAYYKKLYDGDKMMLDLRNKTEKNISKSINRALNDRLRSWQNKLPSWGKHLLANSKLASSLNKYVNTITKNCIQGIFSNSVLSKWNNTLLDNVKKIKDSIKTQFQTTFKGGIEYAQKLKQAVVDKIKLYQKLKTQYEKKIFSAINDFKQKIFGAVQQFTEQLVSSIGNSVKSLASGIKL